MMKKTTKVTVLFMAGITMLCQFQVLTASASDPLLSVLGSLPFNPLPIDILGNLPDPAGIFTSHTGSLSSNTATGLDVLSQFATQHGLPAPKTPSKNVPTGHPNYDAAYDLLDQFAEDHGVNVPKIPRTPVYANPTVTPTPRPEPTPCYSYSCIPGLAPQPKPCDLYYTEPCYYPPKPAPQPPEYGNCRNNRYPSDINGHWAEIYIRRLYDLCITIGFRDGTYRPEQHVTRAELVKMALYAAKIPTQSGCYDNDCGTPFLDLDMWQGPILRTAWDRRIVESAERFYPNQDITRAGATKIILAAFGYTPVYTTKSFFNDVYGWATGWIERAHSLGIVQGIGNGGFNPNGLVTRAEAAKIIAKTIEMEDTRIN